MATKQDSTIPEFVYGTAWKEDRTAPLTELALREGFRGIDTANQRRHYFEAGAGAALATVYKERLLSRSDLFLQTKYTYREGQDHRLPYDAAAPLSVQVAQSLASSLTNLGTDYVDSFVLHGPSSSYGWSSSDSEVWEAMGQERDLGRTRLLGVSNVSVRHLEQMEAKSLELPAFVQNRCYATSGWDRDMRSFCRERKIIYQGFSLLTANVQVLRHPPFNRLADQFGATPAQVIFAFARAVEMLPLTGTSNAEHMRQDLASLNLTLPPDVIEAIDGIAG
ncbi:MAG TPA: aldo/keto reductase [Blastocatellia bacterium]|nr:aldo/keto reductase [Blastocatellia bacterium]